MIDTKAKRAAALGYGLAFLLVLPPAASSISVEDAGHALSAYRFDFEDRIHPTLGMPASYEPALALVASSAPALQLVAGNEASLAFVGEG